MSLEFISQEVSEFSCIWHISEIHFEEDLVYPLYWHNFLQILERISCRNSSKIYGYVARLACVWVYLAQWKHIFSYLTSDITTKTISDCITYKFVESLCYIIEIMKCVCWLHSQTLKKDYQKKYKLKKTLRNGNLGLLLKVNSHLVPE